MAHLTECRELQKHTHTHANIYIMHSILLYIHCMGHDLFAFRSILHASLNGSALQVPTPANRFPGLTDQGYSSWNQPMRTTGGWERGKKQMSFAKPVCLECAPDYNYGMAPARKIYPVSSCCQWLQWSPLPVPVTQTGSDSLLPPLWAALILSSVSEMTLNPTLTTCIPVSAALNKWLVRVWPGRLSVCESTTVFNTAFCRRTPAASGKGEADWRSCWFGGTRLGSIVQVTGHPDLFPQPSRELSYMRSSDTPLPNPHPIVQNARLSLMDIPGLFTAPFSAQGLHGVPGCATF